MNKKLLYFYYIVSALFVVFFLTFAGYRINQMVDRNLLSSKKTLESITLSSLSVYLADGSFDSEYFSQKMTRILERSERLLLLTIYSREAGIVYFVAKDRETAAGLLVSARPWSGEPEFTYRYPWQIKLNAPFAPGIDRDLFIDGLFQQIDRGDLYPILKELFYILLIYVFFSGIILLLVSTSREQAPDLHPSSVLSTAPTASAASTEAASAPVAPTAAAEGKPPGKAQTGPGDTLTLLSPETGLGWARHLEQKLGFELERAASFDQDLALALFALDNPSLLDNAADIVRNLSRTVLENFPFKDLAFEHGSYAFAVIMPARDLDQALKATIEFRKRFNSKWTQPGVSISIGLSARSGRLINGKRLLIEAKNSLKKAQKDGGAQIAAFRADPDKFRKIISPKA